MLLLPLSSITHSNHGVFIIPESDHLPTVFAAGAAGAAGAAALFLSTHILPLQILQQFLNVLAFQFL